jgi:type VII secretion-associated protein (TIGR03931 family)
VVGRVACVRRALVHRYGGAAATPHPLAETGPPPPASGRTRRRPVLVAAALAAVIAVAVVIAVVVVREGPRAPAAVVDRQAHLGRVSLAVPGNWRQSSEPAAEGVVSRTTFAAPTDDRRIIVLQNTVRSTSTLSSVAGSLRNRIDQRGDDVVQEFSASTRYAGREVISYREVPVSGGAIRWYLVVASGLQVSVGCQAGSAGEPIDEQCIVAVGSLRIADR